MAEKIQAHYEAIDQLASNIYQQADQNRVLQRKVSSQVDALGRSWSGVGAQEFQQEMDELVLPALKRLSSSLEITGTTLNRVTTIFQQAEEEAVAGFPEDQDGAHGGFLEWAHNILDVVGFIPGAGVGEVADAVNALIYLGEGRYLDAGISAAGIFMIGDLFKAGRLGTKAGKEVLEAGLQRGAKEASESAAGSTARRSRPFRGQDRPALARGASAPRARLNRFSEPLHVHQGMKRQDEILDLARTNPQEAGRQYERLVASDMQGGLEVENRFRRQGRRMDIGTEHEVTIEGMNGGFGTDKLDQLWDDLADKGNVTLTVPKLSSAAGDQLQRLLAQARAELDPNVIIVIRETLP